MKPVNPALLLLFATFVVSCAMLLAFIGPNDQLTGAVAGGFIVSLREMVQGMLGLNKGASEDE